ncbi:hypothetical protein VTJ04DRAFT_5016 [Mycothermus thermophilus]|uniref:uncharacterized protein n=1 Tax=Humicola insolens TaxID=85995 RepID=UPI0037420380
MTEVQSRPAATRGRQSGRGGRGGIAARGGGRAGSRANGDSKPDPDSSLPTLEDEGEIAELKQQYGSKVDTIKEMFPDWTSVDILFALQETDGDESLAVTRMAEGTISRWSEVSNKIKKDRTRTKAKADGTPTDSAPGAGPRASRGGRAADGGRGRGRGGARGKPAHPSTNGTRSKDSQPLSVPTEEASEWNTKPKEDAPAADTSAATQPASITSTTTPAPTSAPSAPKPAPAPPVKTWASMLRQSTAPKPAPKPKEPPTKAPEPVIEPLPAAAEPAQPEPEAPAPAPAPAETPAEAPEPEPKTEPAPEPAPAPAAEPAPAPPTTIVPVVPAIPAVVVPEVALPPSKDQLTEKNLDQIKDDSHPPVTETAASEAADSWDPRGTLPSGNATPISASQQQHQQAARKPARTPVHHPRRMLDQLEAVRMPGNREVDRAAVQFGAFSLNGTIDDDIDNDREEPETRPQPPQDSPVSHPRTSLPPAQPTPVPDAFPSSQKPAATAQIPTGPAAAAPSAPQAAAPAPSATAQTTVQPPAAQNNQQQFGRFGQPSAQESSSFPTSKPFEPFGQQPTAAASATQNQFEGGFQGQAQQAQAAQPPSQQQQPGGPFSSAPSDFSSYYTADHPSRFNYYNQNFGPQQGAQGQQDALSTQPQRGFGGYNAPGAADLSQYPQSGAAQSRFGASTVADSQTATTAAPGQAATTQAQSGPSTQSQIHGQQPPEYPYNTPYFPNYYYNMGYGYGQGGYPYGKGNLGFPNQYGINPSNPHTYNSPAFGSGLNRDSDYSRVGSGQGTQPGLAGGFGVHDAFGRGASAYQSQAGQSFNAPGSQTGAGPSAGDELKPFGDAKAAGGPSPSLGGPSPSLAGPSPSLGGARPGSAANTQTQTGLPPPQTTQQGNMNVGPYGYGNPAGFGNQNFGSYYYGGYPRGNAGWGSNY